MTRHSEVTMDERMFVNPVDGEMHPESWYRHENIDLDCVIEVVLMDGGLAFDIRPENLQRMEFRDFNIIQLIAHFTLALAQRASESEDPEEAEQCASVAAYVSKIMMGKLQNNDFKIH